MVTRDSVLRLVREGHTYKEAAARLGITPGLAYLTATGSPTDSSDGFSAEDLEREGLLNEPQSLSNPRVEEPDRAAHVRAFLTARAKSDEQMQDAALQAKTS